MYSVYAFLAFFIINFRDIWQAIAYQYIGKTVSDEHSNSLYEVQNM